MTKSWDWTEKRASLTWIIKHKTSSMSHKMGKIEISITKSFLWHTPQGSDKGFIAQGANQIKVSKQKIRRFHKGEFPFLLPLVSITMPYLSNLNFALEALLLNHQRKTWDFYWICQPWQKLTRDENVTEKMAWGVTFCEEKSDEMNHWFL